MDQIKLFLITYIKSKLIIRYENLKKIVCIYIYNFILFFFFVLKSTEYIHSMNVNQINPFGFVPSCFGGLAINLLAYLSAFKTSKWKIVHMGYFYLSNYIILIA